MKSELQTFDEYLYSTDAFLSKMGLKYIISRWIFNTKEIIKSRHGISDEVQAEIGYFEERQNNDVIQPCLDETLESYREFYDKLVLKIRGER